MPKLLMTCRDCGWLECAPGMTRGLCWRPCAGPEVVDLSKTGFCGYECEPSELRQGEFSRDLWVLFHEHPPELLAEVLTLLRMASVGAAAAREAKAKEE